MTQTETRKPLVLPLTTLTEYIDKTRNLNGAVQLHMQYGTDPDEMDWAIQTFNTPSPSNLSSQGNTASAYPIIYVGDFFDEKSIFFNSLNSYPHPQIDTLTQADLESLALRAEEV